MTSAQQANAMVETIGLTGIVTPGNSGATWGYRTTSGTFGAMSATNYRGNVITDMYTDAANNLIIRFTSAPAAGFLKRVRTADSFGGSRNFLASIGSIVGNSYVFTVVPGGAVYASLVPCGFSLFY